MHGNQFLTNLYGEDILQKMGERIGMTIDKEYELASSYGFSMDKEEFYRRYDQEAMYIYAQSTITESIDRLLQTLKAKNYAVGLVSASRKVWIEQVLPRISSSDVFDYVLSLNERKDLQPKPHPDGYHEAMKALNASPQTTIVLEDSNSGIKAAKAAGAYTIAFTQHLVPGYVQIPADKKAKDVTEVLEIIHNIASIK